MLRAVTVAPPRGAPEEHATIPPASRTSTISRATMHYRFTVTENPLLLASGS